MEPVHFFSLGHQCDLVYGPGLAFFRKKLPQVSSIRQKTTGTQSQLPITLKQGGATQPWCALINMMKSIIANVGNDNCEYLLFYSIPVLHTSFRVAYPLHQNCPPSSIPALGRTIELLNLIMWLDKLLFLYCLLDWAI